MLIDASRPIGATFEHPIAKTLPLLRRHMAKTVTKFLSPIRRQLIEATIVFTYATLFIGRKFAVGMITITNQLAALCRQVTPAIETALCLMALIG